MKCIIKFSALVLWASLGLAQTKPNFEPPPKGLRIGMEIELTPHSLANLMNDFDFKKAQKKSAGYVEVPANFYDDYLQNNPNAFSQLPKRLVNKLTQGLQLEETIIHRETGIVDANGKPLASQPKLILPSSVTASAPSQELIIPGRPASGAGSVINENKVPESFQKTQENLVVPKNSSWQKVYERWMALPENEKAMAVKWENLSSKKKAELALNVYESGDRLELKKDLPADVKKVYKNLSWGQDGDALEFRHKENVKITNLNDFYSDVVGLAKRAGVESKILNPQDSKITSATFHYHVSIVGKDLIDRGIALNELAAVQRLNRGILNDVTREGNFIFEPTAQYKGLVRVVEKNRIEIRNHNVPLAEELKFTVNALGMEKNQGLQAIRNQTQSIMSDYAVDKLANRPYLLARFAQYMNPEQKGRIAEQIGWASELQAIHERKIPPTQRFWDKTGELLRDPDYLTSKQTLDILVNTKDLPEHFWKGYIDALKEPGFAVLGRPGAAVAFSKNYASTSPAGIRNIEKQLSEVWTSNPEARATILKLVLNSKVPHSDDLILKMVLDVNKSGTTGWFHGELSKLNINDQQMIKILKALPPGSPMIQEVSGIFSNIDENGRLKTKKALSPELKDAYDRYLSSLSPELREQEIAKKAFAGRPGVSDIYAKILAENRSGEAARMLAETGLDSPQTQETIRKMLRSSDPQDVHAASYILSNYRGRLPVSLANEAAQVTKNLPEGWARSWLNRSLEDNKANRRSSIKSGVNARCVLQSLKTLELKPK